MEKSYCAPDDQSQTSYRKDKTCFALSSLQKLAEAWNSRYKHPPIKNIRGKSKRALWKELNERMMQMCKKSGNEGCWVDKLQMEEASEPFQDLRPPTPAEWYKNPKTWLTNYDIEDVMEQYENEPDNHYHFLGVYPMDFADIYHELNEVKWNHLTKNGTCKYIGMVTNLDYHDEPGSHWTSLFAVLDPKLPSFGVYYYDSVSSPPTSEIKEFMIKLMKRATMASLQKELPQEGMQAIESYPIEKYTHGGAKDFIREVQAVCIRHKVSPPRSFKIAYNTHQHQYKNTECGMFSMVYQIRWIEGLRKDPKLTFDKVVSHRMNDEEVWQFRERLYRPNTHVIVGGKRVRKSS